MKFLISAFLVFMTSFAWAQEVKWSEAKQYRQPNDKSLYEDVLSRNPDAFKSYGTRATTAHEINHGIQSNIRNEYIRKNKTIVNALHIGMGKVAVIDEPMKVRKSWIKQYVPAGLRGARYNLYIEGQTAWDDRPLYIFDEWACYVLDSKVNLQDALVKEPTQRHNGFDSCTEFAVYGIALAMAVERYDPEYFKNNEQFKAFLRWHLKESIRIYNAGMEYSAFRWNTKYYDKLKNGKEAESFRSFVRDKLGMADEEWLK